MEYIKITIDGCILGVAQVTSGGNISKETFDNITAIIHDMPTAPEGYYYQLKESLEWELCEMPREEETATDTDYQNALESLGVNFNV